VGLDGRVATNNGSVFCDSPPSSSKPQRQKLPLQPRINSTHRLAQSQSKGDSGTAAKACRKTDQNFLVQTVLGDGASDEQKVSFIDALSQSLRNGAFLLLIAGDGIRPGLHQIAELLNRSTLGFSLGLVEMAFYRAGEAEPVYVQPRILFRTETVTRTVFVLADKEGKLAIENVTEPTRPQTISEQEFFQKLATWTRLTRRKYAS